MKKYIVIKNPDFNKKENNRYAIVMNQETRNLCLMVVYQPDLFNKTNYHIATTVANLGSPSSSFCLVKMDDTYLRFFDKMPTVFEPVIMHELGHFVHRDYDESKRKKTSTQIYNERILCVMNGIVPMTEILADRFAAENVGASNLIEALRLLIAERQKISEKGSEITIKEFELRIKELERYYMEK